MYNAKRSVNLYRFFKSIVILRSIDSSKCSLLWRPKSVSHILAEYFTTVHFQIPDKISCQHLYIVNRKHNFMIFTIRKDEGLKRKRTNDFAE